MELMRRLRRVAARILRGPPESGDAVQRELQRLGDAPRHRRLTTNLFGFQFDLVDGASFKSMYESIIRRGIYQFESAVADPYIIDCGANVGVSVVYFKRLFPQSRVLAFEADRAIFRTLEANVGRAQMSDVTLVNKAVWTSDGEIEFSHEGADAGRMTQPSDRPSDRRSILQSVRLREYLNRNVDFLKLDIEGAEVDVLVDCAERMTNVRTVFVEYHSFAAQEQRLDALLSTLSAAGFRVFIQTEMCPPQPFAARPSYLGMDLQLNIFGVRPNAAL